MLYIGPKQMSTFGLWSCFSFALLFQSLCCLRCPPKAVTAPLDERRVPSIVTLYLWRRHQSHLFWSQLRWKAKEEKTDAFSKNMRLFLFFFVPVDSSNTCIAPWIWPKIKGTFCSCSSWPKKGPFGSVWPCPLCPKQACARTIAAHNVVISSSHICFA